jgi:Helix-turn-helix domain
MHRVRLYPTAAQEVRLRFMLDVTRQTYNALLDERRYARRARGINITSKMQSAEITALRAEDKALKSCTATARSNWTPLSGASGSPASARSHYGGVARSRPSAGHSWWSGIGGGGPSSNPIVTLWRRPRPDGLWRSTGVFRFGLRRAMPSCFATANTARVFSVSSAGGPDTAKVQEGPGNTAEGRGEKEAVLICMETSSRHFFLLLGRRFHREVIFAASAFGSTG